MPQKFVIDISPDGFSAYTESYQGEETTLNMLASGRSSGDLLKVFEQILQAAGIPHPILLLK